MRFSLLRGPEWVRRWLARPSREVFLRLALLNAIIVIGVLTLGGPLGDLKRMSFSVWWVPHILFAPEVICTALSFVQLLLCAWVVREIWQLRREQSLDLDEPHASTSRSPTSLAPTPHARARLWLWMYVGFLFLAIDEVACIHEGLDKLIHAVLQLRETALSDRLDDFILVAYGAVGLAVLTVHWQEVKLFWRQWAFLLGAGTLAFASCALDLLTNRKDILWLWFEADVASLWWAKLNALEECCKVTAEGVLAGMFCACRDAIAGLRQEATPTPVLLALPTQRASAPRRAA